MCSFFTSLPCQGLQPARLHACYISLFWYPKDLQRSGVMDGVEDLEGQRSECDADRTKLAVS